MIDISLCD